MLGAIASKTTVPVATVVVVILALANLSKLVTF